MEGPEPRVRVVPGGRINPLRRGVYLLPSLLTTGGLFCGFFAVVASVRGEYLHAAIAIMAANVFDVLDGRVARVTRSTSDFGVQYDSLADLVAFGVAPGLLAYCWGLRPWGTWGWLAAALFVTCGALRLARFNVQQDNIEKRHFVGLPIPAAAEMIASTVLLHHYLGGTVVATRQPLMLGLVYLLAGLMVSNVRYFSFKEFEIHRRQPFWVLVAGVVLLNLLVAQPQIFLFTGFTLYTASGPGRWAWIVWRRRVRRRAARQVSASRTASEGHG